MSVTRYDVAIVGAGIIGLATARALALRLPRTRVVVLEKEPAIARHQTGHNSGVIHMGIYYAPGSQKAAFCQAGVRMLRGFCNEHGIPTDACGKVIVATTEEELPRLEDLHRRGTANGADGLQVIGRERLRELEPHVAGIKAIHSPNTGVVNYTRVAAAYLDDLRERGGELLTGARVLAASRASDGLTVETTRGDVAARFVINCAGLHADRVARLMGADTGVRIVPFRGEYFTIRPERAHLVRALVYPVPNPKLPFLGVHFTRGISGGVEAGPNAVLAFAREAYRKRDFNTGDLLDTFAFPGFWRMLRKHWLTGLREQHRSLLKGVFLRSLQALVPEVTMDDLGEPGSGVRAQAVDRKGNLLQDFSIAQSDRAIHVLNAPSPGATASLAIGDHIATLAQGAFDLAP